MSAVAQHLMTAEEFWQLPETAMQRDLVRGEVVETMPPGGLHGGIAVKLAICLGSWAEQGKQGYVGVESGFVLSRDPDIVRWPDVSFVRAERIPESGVPEPFWEIAPDVAVEVVSPNESAADVRDKVHDLLVAGTAEVWVIYPRSREVVVHTPDGLARTYNSAAELVSADVLPGFRCAVADLFA